MGWHRGGKFGIHTGRTLRRHPTKSYYFAAGLGRASKHRHEYAVVKELKFKDPIRRLSFDKSSVKLSVNDGKLPLGEGHVVYSLNKHKRWLLPDLVKEDVEQLCWDEIRRKSEQDSGVPKAYIKKTEKEDTLKVQNLRVTVIERHAANNIDRRQPDCVGVTSSRPSFNSSKPQTRKPRKKYAHVGDLKSKLSSEDDVEVCYEFLSPFPKKCWPFNRQLGQLTRRYYGDEVKGTKSKKKCKGRRNKGCSNLENDGSNLSNACDNEVTNKECGNYMESACSFPLGAYIDDMLKLHNEKEKTSCLPVNTNLVVRSRPVLYGKGDAIYVEKEDQALLHSDIDRNFDNQTVTEIEPLIIVDRKVKFSLLLEDIAPDNLLQQFGSRYIEDDIVPRKFIIKADLSETVPSVCNELEECCLLFEVVDTCTPSSVVEADVAVLVSNDHVMPHNMVEILESDLNSLSRVGPITVNALVDHATEKIISEFECMPKNSCSKKSALSVAKVPVEFIHNVCERKPEICGAIDAVRYSMENTSAKECHVPSKNVNNDHSHCCDICYIQEDEKQDFTKLLQCSHSFCNDCLTMYIMSCIGLGQSCITCPHFKCKTVIGEAIVWSRTNCDIYRRCTKLKRQLAIDVNQQIRHCPAAGCTHTAYISSSTKKESSMALPILCNCGQMWCFGCQKDAHWPASCEEAESFRKKCDDHDNLRKTYHLPGRISSVQVKRCPFCSHPIEKNHGCQHMSCRCGNSFCWECLSPWEGHNWDKCDESRKELEDVELTLDIGNARFNKYSKIALENLIERTGKRLSVFRRLTRRAKQLDGINKLVSFDLETSANRRLRRYTERSLGTFLEQIFHFKYLAHLVLENTAAALAITKTKNMLKTLDKNMRILDFIVRRLNEVFSKPEALSDEKNLESVKFLLCQGEKLIRNIHLYTRARRHTQI